MKIEVQQITATAMMLAKVNHYTQINLNPGWDPGWDHGWDPALYPGWESDQDPGWDPD